MVVGTLYGKLVKAELLASKLRRENLELLTKPSDEVEVDFNPAPEIPLPNPETLGHELCGGALILYRCSTIGYVSAGHCVVKA
eukprot:753267-Rhodomonas_salina.4